MIYLIITILVLSIFQSAVIAALIAFGIKKYKEKLKCLGKVGYSTKSSKNIKQKLKR